MPTGMGATNPKFAKSVRKPKKTEHYTFPEMWQRKSSNNENYKGEIGTNNFKQKKSRRFPKDEVWGNQIKRLHGKRRHQLSKKEERVWIILSHPTFIGCNRR